MKNAWIIASKDIKEILRGRSTYLYIAMMLFISFAFFSTISTTLRSMSRQGAGTAALADTARTIMGIMISTLPLVFNMLFGSFLSNYSVINDKSKRVLESLLATPVTLQQLWIGKTLAVTVPSVIISFVLSVAALFLMNARIIMPITGQFIMPPGERMITGWVLVPMISFLVTMVVVLFQLILPNPRIANFIFMLLFFAVFWIPTTPAMQSLNITAIYLSLIGGLAVLNVILLQLLTKERVILSSKG